MDHTELNENQCMISKINRKVDGSGTIFDETTITIVGKSLDECFNYYKKVKI